MTKNDPDFDITKMDLNEFKIFVMQRFEYIEREIKYIKEDVKEIRGDIKEIRREMNNMRSLVLKAIGASTAILAILVSIITNVI